MFSGGGGSGSSASAMQNFQGRQSPASGAKTKRGGAEPWLAQKPGGSGEDGDTSVPTDTPRTYGSSSDEDWADHAAALDPQRKALMEPFKSWRDGCNMWNAAASTVQGGRRRSFGVTHEATEDAAEEAAWAASLYAAIPEALSNDVLEEAPNNTNRATTQSRFISGSGSGEASAPLGPLPAATFANLGLCGSSLDAALFEAFAPHSNNWQVAAPSETQASDQSGVQLPAVPAGAKSPQTSSAESHGSTGNYHSGSGQKGSAHGAGCADQTDHFLAPVDLDKAEARRRGDELLAMLWDFAPTNSETQETDEEKEAGVRPDFEVRGGYLTPDEFEDRYVLGSEGSAQQNCGQDQMVSIASACHQVVEQRAQVSQPCQQWQMSGMGHPMATTCEVQSSLTAAADCWTGHSNCGFWVPNLSLPVS